MSVSQGKVKHRSSWVKPAGPGQRLVAGDDRDGGGLRESPTGDQIDRGLVLRVAGARAHLVGQVGGAGVERARRNRARGGGRSTGALGSGATVPVGWRAWLLRHLRGAVSTWVCSVGGCGGCGHGGERLGGGAVRSPAKSTARGRVGEGKQGGNDGGSQRGRTESKSRPGKHGRRRIEDEVAGGRRLKKSSKATLQGFRRGVAR